MILLVLFEFVPKSIKHEPLPNAVLATVKLTSNSLLAGIVSHQNRIKYFFESFSFSLSGHHEDHDFIQK